MFDISCKFHLPANTPWRDAGTALDALRPAARWLGEHDPTMQRWYLGGDTLAQAQLYEAFSDLPNGHSASQAVLRAEFERTHDSVVFLWNGDDSRITGASLSLSVSSPPYLSSIELGLSGPVKSPRIGDYKKTAEFVALLAVDTAAECCYVYHAAGYWPRMTFKDRPGVGWMLYLPRVFTPDDIPEARALIPVHEDKRRRGTIIVSVTDGVFDHRNAEHLDIARAIETRLVSHDWLPTWEQMLRRDA